MVLTTEQIAEVENIYLRNCEEDDYDLEAAIVALPSSEQLHLFVYNWNWDSGVEPLRVIVNHPQCDKGTALNIFWACDALGFFQKYNDRSEVDTWALEVYDLAVEIKDKFQQGVYTTENIYFNPEPYWVTPPIGGKQYYERDLKLKNLKQEIPDEMLKPTSGQDIEEYMEHFGLS